MARRAVALGLGAVVVSGLLVATAVVASTSTAQRVAANARSLHWANSTLGTTSIARASVSQAVFFAVDLDLGVASADAASVALEGARHDLGLVKTLAEGSPDGTVVAPAEIRNSLERFVTMGDEVLDLVAEGDSAAAADLKVSGLERTFEEATQRLAIHQQTVAGAIAATEDFSGRIDTITRVGIMLALPAVALLIYRNRAKRSLEAAKRAHAAEIEVEKRAAAAKDEFFAAVSHGLRTPLTTILGFSEVLADGSAPVEEHVDLAELIRTDAIDLERRIDDMVVAARASAGPIELHAETFDVADAVANAVSAASPSKAIAVECERAQVRADRRAVTQIVRNLVSNADRHGGASIAIAGRADSDRYLITVTDDGEGFDPTPLASSREQFAHSHRAAILEGSVGLGLAATIALTEAVPGELAYRRLGGRTQLGVFLPLALSPSDDAPKDDQDSAAA